MKRDLSLFLVLDVDYRPRNRTGPAPYLHSMEEHRPPARSLGRTRSGLLTLDRREKSLPDFHRTLQEIRVNLRAIPGQRLRRGRHRAQSHQASVF